MRSPWTKVAWAATAVAAAGVWSSPLLPAGASGGRPSAGPTAMVSITTLTDGAAPFSAADGAGEDSALGNGRVRAGDVVSLAVNVVPLGSGTGLTEADVVVDITSTAGLVVWSDTLPAGCTASAGTVHCNLGRRTVGAAVDLTFDGRAAERGAVGEAAGSLAVSSGGAEAATPLTVTAAAPSVDAVLTAPRFAGATTRNGVFGVLAVYGLHLTSPRTVASISGPAGSTLETLVDASAIGSGVEIVGCSANGDPAGAFVFTAAVSGRHVAADVAPEAKLADGGTWSCTPDGARARVTVSGVDTNPDTFPSQVWNQAPVAPETGIVSSGALTVFVPLASIGENATASVSLSPVAGNVEGQANHGTCTDVDALAAGVCGAAVTRQDPLTTSSVGVPTSSITVFHVAEQPVVRAGSAVVWHYTVTNTGSVTLNGVGAVDSGAAALAATAPGALAPGQQWIFTLQGTQTPAPLHSVVTVTGHPSTGSPVSAVHEVVTTSSPAVEPTTLEPPAVVEPVALAPAAALVSNTLKLYVDGVEFTALPGPLAVVGINNVIEYEVKNTSAVSISNVVVEDSSITNDATAIDCGLDATNKNRIATMAAGSTVVCARTIQPVAGTITFTASVTVGGVADATLNAGYQAKPAAIDLELAVNGQDADTAPGPSVTVNSLLTFGYVVRNIGQIDLADVFVSHVDDEDGVYDDIACAAINDDDNGDASIDLLKVGQTVNCTFTPRAIAGAFSTQASAVANPVNADGDPLANDDGTIELTDTDRVNYTGVTTGGGTTTTTQVGQTTTTTVPAIIGDGGSNTAPVVITASGAFLAGFGLWSVARRRRRFSLR